MYDGGKIITGLMIFVLFVTFHIWYNHGYAVAIPKVEKAKYGEQCVLPADVMRAEHMQLLNEWRDQVLRTGDRSFNVEVNGKKYQQSLMNTCMQCHTSKEKFCDTCHEYVSVVPYCWDCHIAPEDMN